MDYSILIALLRAKQYLTDLEKDILDTWDEWKKEPFDYNSAQRQVMQNNAKIPRDIYCNQGSADDSDSSFDPDNGS